MEFYSFVKMLIFFLGITLLPLQMNCQNTTVSNTAANSGSVRNATTTSTVTTKATTTTNTTAASNTTVTPTTTTQTTAPTSNKTSVPNDVETTKTTVTTKLTSTDAETTTSISSSDAKTTTRKSVISAAQSYSRVNDSMLCENGGILFKSGREERCSCAEEYYGTNCENKAHSYYIKLIFGLAILAGILLLIALFLGCQWHKRLHDIDVKGMELKELLAQRNQYKNQNRELRKRTPSPTRSNYAGSVMTGQDDRRSVYNMSMPNFDSITGNTDTAINIDDDDLSGDERDSRRHPKKAIDTVSIVSGSVGSNADSEDALLRPIYGSRDKRKSWAGLTIDDEGYDTNLRKPRSTSHGNVSIDNRGYVKQADFPNNELSVENIKDFNEKNGALRDPRGKAKSLTDLRVLALTSDKNNLTVGNKNMGKTRSIENISTGQIHKLAVGGGEKPKGKGIWARSQHQQTQDSAFSTSAF